METSKNKSENSEKIAKVNHPNIEYDKDFDEDSNDTDRENESTKTKQQKDSIVNQDHRDGKPSPNDLKEKSDYNGQVRKDAQHPSDKKGGVKDKNLSQKRTF